MSLPRPDIAPTTPNAPRKRARESIAQDQIDPRVKRQLFPQWGLPRPVLNNIGVNFQPTIAVRGETPAQRARRQFRARTRRNGHVRRRLILKNQEHEE